ncbi:MAG: sensor histidine kinase, partial [Ginsengibacter sp.]
HIAKDVTIKASRSLLEVLISNLLRNAVEHNVALGKMFLGLSVSHLIVRNTGPDLRTDPELLFERFRKDSHQTKNVGLGLALVNQICNLYGYVIIYKFENGWHIVEIRFPENAD